MLKQITLKNLLSFGPDTQALELKPLNVLIGPNGSGKSNLIEAISLLQYAPLELAMGVRHSGGIRDWLWKGVKSPIASVEVVVDDPVGSQHLRHVLLFTESNQRFELVDERIENEFADDNLAEPFSYYRFQQGKPVLNVKQRDQPRQLRLELVDAEKSILSQVKDPDQYPEITTLGERYWKIHVYREWSFGRDSRPRQPQKADQPNDILSEDCENLGLVLNRLRREPGVKRRLLENLNELYPGIDDFDVSIEGGTVQVFLQEGRFNIPATRLSDGTLRYLCLLAILCHPQPPPLVCIEEPELGLHPDVMASLGRLLKDASTRTQLIVTTHSDQLVDSLTDSPEDVIVCSKEQGCTQMERLDRSTLEDWLEKYTLGELWRRGEVGGNRW
jgi:predicted ATPase